MQGLFDIASRISTPLALAGFLVAAFFLIVRAIIVKNIFPTLTRQLSGDIIKLIIDRLFILSLVAMVLGFVGFVVTRMAADTVNDSRTVHARSLLVAYDSRIIQLASVARQIDDAEKPFDKGNLTLCVFHLLKGTGVCNGGVQITPMVTLVNELATIDLGVDPTEVLTTLTDLESERGEIIVPTDQGARGVYPPGVLNQRLDSLRAYSREAWRHVGGKPTGNASTSGPNSPAVSGDGNSVTYGQPEADKKKKETKKAKE